MSSLRTWLVEYPDGHRFHGYPDEIDARSLDDAERQAADLYEPGYTLVEIEPGGSGGIVSIWSER